MTNSELSQPNLFAGMGSHQSARAQTTTWLTPPEILEPLGEFDLDPCAHPGWITARRHYYKSDNGMTQKWDGRVWCNPPYTSNEIRRWMWRMKEHNLGTALAFARTETRWFFESVWNHASALLFLKRRINFYYPDGRQSGKNAGAPSVLIAYGEQDCDRLASSGLNGAFVILQNQSWSVLAIPKTWAQVVREAFGDAVSLPLCDLYERVAGHPKTDENAHWRDKVRQVVQREHCFERVSRGVWRLTTSGTHE
ncbi:MAG: DNA N-6-adenine-methyltransferase [Planctomycetota bacterium]